MKHTGELLFTIVVIVITNRLKNVMCFVCLGRNFIIIITEFIIA